jgi:hypothetical protein
VLYSFTGGSDGWLPEGDLLFQNGNIIGTTQDGGIYNSCNGFTGCGVVFKLTPSGGGWTESVLWSFGNGTDGIIPLSGVVPDQSGNLYGAALAGGTYGYGGVYQLTPSLTESVIYSFQGLADGYYGGGGVILDPAGNIYGTTLEGGAGGGTAYELTNGTWAYNLVGPILRCTTLRAATTARIRMPAWFSTPTAISMAQPTGAALPAMEPSSRSHRWTGSQTRNRG